MTSSYDLFCCITLPIVQVDDLSLVIAVSSHLDCCRTKWNELGTNVFVNICSVVVIISGAVGFCKTNKACFLKRFRSHSHWEIHCVIVMSICKFGHWWRYCSLMIGDITGKGILIALKQFFFKNNTTHPVSTNSHPTATTNIATHCLKKEDIKPTVTSYNSDKAMHPTHVSENNSSSRDANNAKRQKSRCAVKMQLFWCSFIKQTHRYLADFRSRYHNNKGNL